MKFPFKFRILAMLGATKIDIVVPASCREEAKEKFLNDNKVDRIVRIDKV